MTEFSEETLLDRAYTNLQAARVLLQANQGDDLFCNIIAYHLQQAIELSIKYQLEQEGVNYPHEHDIGILIRVAQKHGVELCITDYIEEHSDMLSNWESKTRYVKNYLVELRRIEKAIPEIESSLSWCKKEFGEPFRGMNEPDYD